MKKIFALFVLLMLFSSCSVNKIDVYKEMVCLVQRVINEEEGLVFIPYSILELDSECNMSQAIDLLIKKAQDDQARNLAMKDPGLSDKIVMIYESVRANSEMVDTEALKHVLNYYDETYRNKIRNYNICAEKALVSEADNSAILVLDVRKRNVFKSYGAILAFIKKTQNNIIISCEFLEGAIENIFLLDLEMILAEVEG